MNELKERKKPILIAAMQWFITTILQIDRLFFTYDYESKYLVVTKMLYLIVLLSVWCFIFETGKKIKFGDEAWQRGFFIFKVYFCLMMLLLLLLWPGTWSWDDLGTLNAISTYESWNAWQHVLTGIYQDVLLQILPFPGGIIFLQNAIVALSVAFIVTKLEISFHIAKIKNGVIDMIIKLLPFLTPPVLMYQFSGYRLGLYVYIELVMLVMLICAWKDEKKWNLKYLILFAILCVIVATWRTESFLYIPCICVLLLFAKKSVISNMKKVLCIVILAIGFLNINNLQKYELGNSNYEIISLLRPCVELVRAADCEADADELAIIDKVTDLEVIRNNPTFNGEELYWNTECVRNKNNNPYDDYTDKDYSAYLRAFIKLSLKYPEVVIKERWNMFLTGSGITGESRTNVSSAAALFEINNESWAAKIILSKGRIANLPVLKKTRSTVINILGIRNNKGNVIVWLYRIVWNAIIPEIILLYAWIKMLIKKKWFFAGICSAVLIRLPVVVLTQPSPWIMYVLSFYFLGYVFLVYDILICWSEHKKSKEISTDE